MELINQKDIFLFGYKVEYPAPSTRDPAWFVHSTCKFDTFNRALDRWTLYDR